MRLGAEAILSLKVYIHASAFESIQPRSIDSDTPISSSVKDSSPPPPKKKGKGKEPEKKKKKQGFYAELQETDQEVRLRERKSAMIKLFDAMGLRPIRSDEALNKTTGMSKKEKKKKDKKGKGKEKEDAASDEEEGALDEKEVTAVYAKATRNDVNLPCVIVQ